MKSPLEPSVYADDAIFRDEQKIFLSLWNCVALRSQLSENNDYVVRNIGGRSIVIQNMKGEIKAFENVCSHRFSKIQTENCGNRPLQCPYHGWTYNSQGIPSGIPNRPRFDDVTKEWCASLALRSWSVGFTGEFIFIKCTEEGPGLLDFLGPVAETLDDISKGIGRCYSSDTIEIAANWKILVENTLESYHVDFVHPDTFRSLGVAEGSFEFNNLHSSWSASVSAELIKKMKAPLRSLGDLSYSINGYRHQLLFPNVTIATTLGSSFSVQFFQPLAVNKTIFTTSLFEPKTTSTSKSSSAIKSSLCNSVQKFNTKVFLEDKNICELVQEGCEAFSSSVAFGSSVGQLSDEEERVAHFQKKYCEQFRTQSDPQESIRWVIVGAGDFGRELASWLLSDQNPQQSSEKNIVLIDDNTEEDVQVGDFSLPVLSTIQRYVKQSGDRVLLAITDVETREKIASYFSGIGIPYSTTSNKGH